MAMLVFNLCGLLLTYAIERLQGILPFNPQGLPGVEPRLALTQSLGSRVREKLGGGAYAQHLQLVSTEGLSGADFWVPTDASAEAGRSW